MAPHYMLNLRDDGQLSNQMVAVIVALAFVVTMLVLLIVSCFRRGVMYTLSGLMDFLSGPCRCFGSRGNCDGLVEEKGKRGLGGGRRPPGSVERGLAARAG